MGKRFIKEGITNPQVLAIDQKLFSAKGPLWHVKDRKKGEIPNSLTGVDKDSEWGYCSNKGWVQGYSLDILCTATKGSPTVPIDASSDTANVDGKGFASDALINLPSSTKYVGADGNYDSNELICLVEEKKNEKYITRRLVTPIGTGKSSSKERKDYKRYLKTKKGKEVYNRRSVTVEPLFEKIKSLFEMEPVWMRGKMNVAPLLLLCVYTYQLLLYYNVVKEQSLVKESTGQRLAIANVKYILDGL
ncbi:transposase [bacterium]|nr:transposase [bacterium]